MNATWLETKETDTKYISERFTCLRTGAHMLAVFTHVGVSPQDRDVSKDSSSDGKTS